MPGIDAAERASKSIVALERKDSLSKYFIQPLQAQKIFDRTSLNLSLWLPWSRRAGGRSRRISNISSSSTTATGYGDQDARAGSQLCLSS